MEKTGVFLLTLGASLLCLAGPAQGGNLRQGGTLRVNLPVTDIDDIDPSTAYGTTTWQIEYSTALKLLNYPDAAGPRGSRLVPEGASSFRVSKDGRTYTFTIRRGFRFSDGQPVTARNYAFAVNRALSRDLQSPAFQFIADANGTNIAGAQAVRDGESETARGVQVRGNKLIVRLTKPDGTFLSKITMPFFQAMPLGLSSTEKAIEVDADQPLPSAGPYYVSFRKPNSLVTIERNPFYARNVSRKYPRRPRRLARIAIKTGVNLQSSYLEVRANQADYALDLPASAPAELARDFGLNGRFRVRPVNCVSYIAMNTSNPLFRNNPQLRRAVNYAIDRRAMAALSGPYAAVPTDQYLPSGIPGFKNIDAYPFAGDIAKARELAAGHVPSGGPWIYYYGLSSPGPQRMELVRQALDQIGITLDPRGSRSGAWEFGKRNSPHAFVTGGWCQDYPDPYDFINVLLYGGTIQDENNNNVSFFDNSSYNKRMVRAARLIGDARLNTYARLEHDLVTKAAPWAAWSQPANQLFFSDSVDMRSFVYQPIYEAPPYNLLALK